MRLSSWGEAKLVGEALLVFLADHCPGCGARHTTACLDGGRCVYCQHSLCTLNGGLAQAVEEAKEKL
jgi:hypothetical protein